MQCQVVFQRGVPCGAAAHLCQIAVHVGVLPSVAESESGVSVGKPVDLAHDGEQFAARQSDGLVVHGDGASRIDEVGFGHVVRAVTLASFRQLHLRVRHRVPTLDPVRGDVKATGTGVVRVETAYQRAARIEFPEVRVHSPQIAHIRLSLPTVFTASRCSIDPATYRSSAWRTIFCSNTGAMVWLTVWLFVTGWLSTIGFGL